MMLKRVQGKASFATIQDATGRIQLYINDEGVGEATHQAFKHWDLGDIVAVTGRLFKTMKGEMSVRASSASVAFYGCKIPPADVQEALFRLPELARQVDAFRLHTFDDSQGDKRLIVLLEVEIGRAHV